MKGVLAKPKTNQPIKSMSIVRRKKQALDLHAGQPTTGKPIALTLVRVDDNNPYNTFNGDNYDRILDRPLLPRLLGTFTPRSDQCNPRFGDVLSIHGYSRKKSNGQKLTVIHLTNHS